MKITTTLGNTKADKATKLANLLGANHRHVRHSGHIYFIQVQKVGPLMLGMGTDINHKTEVNLFGKDTLAKELKKLCENRLYT